MISPVPLLVICGPTASGKTRLAVELSKRWPIEVISADSRQIYRHMNIGTAKASSDEQAAVPHHLIDIRDPDQSYSVADFIREAQTTVEDVQGRGLLPVVVGGTGLYIRGLVRGLAATPPGDDALREQLKQEEERVPGTLFARLQAADPEQADRIHPNNLVRITRALEVFILSGKKLSQWQEEHAFSESPYRTLTIGLNPPNPILNQRIRERSHVMLSDGLVEETAWLLKRYPADGQALQTLGYVETQGFLRGETSLEETGNLIHLHTRQYAKRQITWFKKEPDVYWLASSDMSGNIQKLIENFYEN